jgi:hypothetical protein
MNAKLMNTLRGLALFCLLAASAAAMAQGIAPESEAEQLESSRDAGLLTDWHLLGHYGRAFAHRHAPEKIAARLRSGQMARAYELVFPSGAFTLPQATAEKSGVFYAVSATYLMNGGEWNVYLESPDAIELILDGKPVICRQRGEIGTSRVQVHASEGIHSILVKFTADAAPFRVAILPLNSGSRRKNNTPYLKAAPQSEDMMSALAVAEAAGE